MTLPDPPDVIDLTASSPFHIQISDDETPPGTLTRDDIQKTRRKKRQKATSQDRRVLPNLDTALNEPAPILNRRGTSVRDAKSERHLMEERTSAEQSRRHHDHDSHDRNERRTRRDNQDRRRDPDGRHRSSNRRRNDQEDDSHAQHTQGYSEDERDRAQRRKKHKNKRRRSPSPLFCVDVEPVVVAAEDKLPLPFVPVTVEALTQDSLLLPSHVTISNGTGDSLPACVRPLSPLPSDEEDFISYMDYDETQKGAMRYFDDAIDVIDKRKTFLCKKCGAEGDHKTFECLVMICLTCGARDEHSTRGCPISKTCFSCGMKGHIYKDCSRRGEASGAGHIDCERCGSYVHKANECPTLWRMYEYVTDMERAGILHARREMENAAIGSGGEGYIAEDEWCYHCGEDGHLGDDCDVVPFPADFPKEPSAFSLYNSMSGPFADANAPRRRRHREPHEWERGGMFDDGYGFTGPSDVGRKGKDKERQRMRKRVNDLEEAEDDTEDWFQRQSARGNGRGARPPPVPHLNDTKQSIELSIRGAALSNGVDSDQGDSRGSRITQHPRSSGSGQQRFRGSYARR